MQDPRERLFRDDAGAALERATRLEDENRRLRAEIDRLRHGPAHGPVLGDPPADLALPRRSDDRVIAAVVLGMVTLFAGVTLAARPHAGRASCGARRSAAFALQANPGIAVSEPAIVSSPSGSQDSCAEPFVIAEGMGLAMKAECIRPASTLAREPEPVPAASARPGCEIPYVVDESGRRRYKVDCLR